MGEPEKDPLEPLKGLAEKYSQVKLGAGVVGKTGTVVLALVPVWMLVLWRLNENVYFDIALLSAGAAVTSLAIWWIRKSHKFAEKYPGAALLEGAQLVEYQRFEAEAKGIAPKRGRIVVAKPRELDAPDE